MIISRIIEGKKPKKGNVSRTGEYLSVKTSHTNNTQCQSSRVRKTLFFSHSSEGSKKVPIYQKNQKVEKISEKKSMFSECAQQFLAVVVTVVSSGAVVGGKY